MRLAPLAALMASAFDADAFMSTSFSEATATTVMPVPPGDYVALIEDVKARQAKDSTVLDVVWNIDDPAVKEKLGRTKVTVRQSVFLDFNESGGLAFGEGKNVQLGRLRKAVNQNTAGQPWQPMMLKGQGAKIKVTHRIDKDTGITYDQVSAVAPLG